MSKSPTRRLGTLQGKLKLTEQEKSLHIRMFLLYSRYSTVGVVGRFQSHRVYQIFGFKFRYSPRHLECANIFSGLFFTVVSFGQNCIVEWRYGW